MIVESGRLILGDQLAGHLDSACPKFDMDIFTRGRMERHGSAGRQWRLDAPMQKAFDAARDGWNSRKRERAVGCGLRGQLREIVRLIPAHRTNGAENDVAIGDWLSRLRGPAQ